MDKIRALSQKKGLKGVCALFESKWFPAFVGLITLFFYLCKLPLWGVACYFILFTFIFLFCDTVRPAMAIFLTGFFSLRYLYNAKAYLGWNAILIYVLLGAPLLSSMYYRIRYRRVEWKRRSGLWNMALLSAIFLVGGVYSDYYDFQNLLRAVGRVAAIMGTYGFLAFTLERKEDNFLYLAHICASVIGVLVLQMLHLYFDKYTTGVTIAPSWKNDAGLGWGVSTVVGETITFLLPALFYLIYKEKRGYLYWGLIIIAIFGVYLTFGRNALLWAGITTLVGAIVSCRIGRYKKVNRYIVGLGVCLLIGLGAYLYTQGFFKKVFAIFLELGFNDNGRFALWKEFIQFFKEFPVFGVGFRAHCIVSGQTSVANAHNTIIQMLASTGVIGFAGYLLHRVNTVKMLLKNPTVDNCMMGGCILTALLMSMLSSYFCFLYFLIYYVVIMLFFEKSLDE